MKKILSTIMMLLTVSVSFSQSYKLKYPTITLDAVNGTTVPYNFTVQGISNLNSITTSGFELTGGTFSLPYSNTTVILGDGSRYSLSNFYNGFDAVKITNYSRFNVGITGTGGRLNTNTWMNTDVGFNAGRNSTGMSSVNLGYAAGANSTAFGAIAIGKESRTNGHYGIAIGTSTGASVNDISIGSSSGRLSQNLPGINNNIRIGTLTSTYGDNTAFNSIIGYYQFSNGSYNNFLGRSEGYTDYPYSKRLGSGNNGFGNSSLQNLTTGSDNIVIGNYSGNAITTGSYNTIIGGSVPGNPGDNWVTIADGQGNKVFETQATDRTPGQILITDLSGVGRYGNLLGAAGPTYSTSVGTQGRMGINNDDGIWYLYVCIATNTWVRAALTSW